MNFNYLQKINKKDIQLNNGHISFTAHFTQKIVAQLVSQQRFGGVAFIYNVLPTLAALTGKQQQSLTVQADRLLVELFKTLSEQVFSLLFSDRWHMDSMTLLDYRMDGYNINEDFKPHDCLSSREAFQSVKCIHFDGVEPLAANIYGPNINICGGHPVVADVRSYAKDNNFDIQDLIERVPGGYAITIKQAHYQAILDFYSICFEFDMSNDLPLLITLNDITTGGIAHGAIKPAPINASQTAKRPLHHLALDLKHKADIEQWYRDLRLDPYPNLSLPSTSLDLLNEKVYLSSKGPQIVRDQ